MESAVRQFSIKRFINELKVKPFIIALAVPFGVQLLSYFVTKGSMSFYSEINKPPLAPPGWLFPVVWTLLYALMGISSYIVWNERSEYSRALSVSSLRFAWRIAPRGYVPVMM